MANIIVGDIDTANIIVVNAETVSIVRGVARRRPGSTGFNIFPLVFKLNR